MTEELSGRRTKVETPCCNAHQPSSGVDSHKITNGGDVKGMMLLRAFVKIKLWGRYREGDHLVFLPNLAR